MRFSLSVAALCRTLQGDWAQRRVSDQLFRSATSVAANDHAASRGRPTKESLAKLGVVAEEAKETVFWLEFAARAGMTGVEAAPVGREAREVFAIFIASHKTVAANLKRS